MSRLARVATISVHTSPLDQPGTGDAGGMNVYIVEVAKRMAERGIEVDMFTRATTRALPPVAELAPGVLVRHVAAGPLEELDKADLPGQMCAFTSGLLRTEALHEPGHYDLIHSHYWLSGQAGQAARRRWGVPLVHSMHTLAKVKNAALAEGDSPEPLGRVLGEQRIVDCADRLIANTGDEAEQLMALYDADPEQVATVFPGADLATFLRRPRAATHAAGSACPRTGPSCCSSAASSRSRRPTCSCAPPPRWWRTTRRSGNACSSPSSAGPAVPAGPARRSCGGSPRASASPTSCASTPPCPQNELADWYRAADLTVVPSHSESFGLVAVESQACGTPVVAASVGGLRTAVRDGESGVLVEGHDPGVRRVLRDLARRPGAAARHVACRGAPRRRVRLASYGRPAGRGVRRGRERTDDGAARLTRRIRWTTT